MRNTQPIRIALEPREVTLHYPGAEGVRFEDAVLAIGNEGDAAVEKVSLHLKVVEEGKGTAPLLDAEVSLEELGHTGALAPQAEAKASLFRLLQKKSRGFASRINMFGFKAALDWRFRVEATIPGGAGDPAQGASSSWTVHWSVGTDDPGRVRLHVE